jgi:hypothetical protein
MLGPSRHKYLSRGVKKLDRRYKHKIESRLEQALESLSEDMRIILTSNDLKTFNLKRYSLWREALEVLRDGCDSLAKTKGKIEYHILDTVKKDRKATYFEAEKGTITISMPTISSRDPVVSPMVSGVPLGSENEKWDFFEFLENPEELAIQVSLRRIKNRRARSILTRALKYNYPFPDEHHAVSLSIIKGWVDQKELLKR